MKFHLIFSFILIFFLRSIQCKNSTSLIVGRPFKLRLASIFVRQRDLTVYYEIVKPAIDLAVEECNRKYKNFIDIKITTRNDSELCSSTYAPSLAGEEYYLNSVMGFIGPACLYSLDIIGRLASFWNIPIFSAGGSSVEFNDKTLFTTLTRLSYSLERISDFIIQTLKEYEWKHLAFIVDDGDLTMVSVDRTIKEAIKEERSKSDYDLSYTTQSFTYASNSTINYKKLLTEASQEARIFILLVKGQTLREILLNAYDLGMYKGDYVFIGIELIKAKKADAIEWYKYGDKRNKEAKTIFESLIIFAVKIPISNNYRNFVYEVSKRARNEFKDDFTTEDVNQNIASFYDALLLYCLALNETLEDGDNPYDAKQITKRIWGRTFTNVGISGDILINSNGDRETTYSLDAFDKETGQFRSIFNYYGNKRKIEKVPGVIIQWANKQNKPPLDVPECGFKNDKPECIRKTDSTLLFVILVIVLCLLFALSYVFYRVYVKINYESKLNDYWWKIHWEDIQFADRANVRNKSAVSLGKSQTSFITQTQTFITGKSSGLSSMATTMANIDSSILCGHYKGARVAVKCINVPKLNITRENLVEFKQMRDIIQNNLVKFVGMVVEESTTAIVNELCVRGSLKDMLENEKITIDWMFKCSMINDIIEGMAYLHNSPIEYHGHLKSTNLVVDSRFNVAICDYGLRSVYSQIKTNDDEFNPRSLYWTAPEHLRERFPSKSGSKKGDVYSFAIIMQEIITRMGPWENLPNQHNRVKAGTLPPFRPDINPEDCEAPEILPILSLCWAEQPNIRPDFSELKQKLKKITRGITSSKLLDNLMKRIETYSSNLEKIVLEKTENILIEKARAEELLNNILPQFIVDQLKNNVPVVPESFPSVTLMFSDVDGFQQLSKESTPQQIVNMLNDIYDLLDNILVNHDVYKLESINDAYLVASGVPVKNGSEHVREIAYCALEAREAIEKFKCRHRPNHKFRIRIGFHSGSVVAGVIGRFIFAKKLSKNILIKTNQILNKLGIKMPKYCLFGDTINTASRMQTNGEAGKIHISGKSKELLDLFGDFVILPRGEVQIKGKGGMKTFWLDSASAKKTTKRSKTRSQQSKDQQQPSIDKQDTTNLVKQESQIAENPSTKTTSQNPPLTKSNSAVNKSNDNKNEKNNSNK